ncbi:4-(cytidine 5'-diphospho)-2-C-methyl-D-erythritol kinase [Fimbriimonas ginsengisoli]|uniref:4-diphosphocytidyl-2-C-methyl-D-erythritol kinase n=1 Tax=Fimbriimonas ginsengisoli Gsoil 348 TaxID=661478 RepID=A0A068NM45_FIMGI|nr:4-(cytidine 5'-diphospho)-2-C-methyl-D-erythritol kinase [Fimbriimonas ginsengisoli]AIE84623.1 4-diphosphocytidyl-2C-methyl-D-erythritol kinase [Fimbriimonas ginsengisoli Gsoil 348]
MTSRLVVPCPAKVNLFLAVGPRDERGYHPLRTIFQAIDLCDILVIETNPAEPGFFCDDPGVPLDNTVTKAMRLIPSLPPLRVTLEKKIPSESGLGGGSSDAAGLLRAAIKLGFLAPEDAPAIALSIGADVPFFLVGGRARAEGYGERLEPLPDRETEWLVVVRPDVGCPTGPAFAKLDERPYEWREFPADDLLYNDFERVAPRYCLDLIDRLRALGATDAALTGSGSAVFGRFASLEEAERAKEKLVQEGFVRIWVTRTLTRAESLYLE